jgi:hypothetical protein
LENEEMRDRDATAQERGGRKHHLRTFILAVVAAWVLGTCAFVYFYPHLIYNALERAMVKHGISGDGSSGIPVNTLYAMPELASPTTSTCICLCGHAYHRHEGGRLPRERSGLEGAGATGTAADILAG